MTYYVSEDEREPQEPCQKGTVGCAVDHRADEPETNCEGW